jgi:hypothetical protein
MKTIVQAFQLAALLGAGLYFSGCATEPVVKTSLRSTRHFTSQVVESSTDHALTPAELRQVRAGAINFVESQPQLGPGNYYVRVDFAPDAPGAAAGWAIVRITADDAARYTLLSQYAEPEAGYNYPDDSYDDYPDFRFFSASYGYYDPYEYYYPGYSRPLRPRHPSDAGQPRRQANPRDDHRDDRRTGSGPGPDNHSDRRTRDGDDRSHPDRNQRPAYDGNRRPELAPTSAPARSPGNTPRGSDGGGRGGYTPPASSRESYSPPARSAPPSPAPAPSGSSSSPSRETRDTDAHTAR